jgi:hypothetical protein
LFAIYALEQRPALFQRIVAASPSLEWDGRLLLTAARDRLRRLSAHVRLDLSVGDDGDNTDSTTAFAKTLDELKPAGLDYRFDALLSRSREERLHKNVVACRHEWMVGKTRALTEQGSRIAKAVTLQVLMEHLNDNWKRKTDEYGDTLRSEIATVAGRKIAEADQGYGVMLGMSDYLNVPPNELDGFLHRAALAYAHQEDDEWLNATINALDIDYTKEFVLTREYLDLYTKDQLVKLAKQAKVTAFTKDEIAKKPALIDAILRGAPKGFVPKDFLRAAKA